MQMISGDAQGSAHCIELSERAAVPYLHMLELWLYRGTIQDPYAEFICHILLLWRVSAHLSTKETVLVQLL